MPDVVNDNESQFGFFGVALALVTWFSGAAICILLGACAGVVFAEDTGRVGTFVRGGDAPALVAGRAPATPATRTRAQPSRHVPEHRRVMTLSEQSPTNRGCREASAHVSVN